MSAFEKIFQESKIVLTEGALVERLKDEFDLQMDQHVNHALLIYDNPEILEALYRQYIDIARRYNLPVMIMTPTRKVNSESIKLSKYKDRQLLSDSFLFLNKIRQSYQGFKQKILIGGLLGCKGDAYSGEQVFTVEEAYQFHKSQTSLFQNTNIDYLFAGIMPEINEATGMARAMAKTNIPYIISFMIRKDGCLIDGTVLSDAIAILDEQTMPNPICYMTNCIHPSNLKEALLHPQNKGRIELRRFSGIQANASSLSPEELNNCAILQQDDFGHLIAEICVLQEQFGLKVFGGCCGTNDQFIADLSDRLIGAAQNDT